MAQLPGVAAAGELIPAARFPGELDALDSLLKRVCRAQLIGVGGINNILQIPKAFVLRALRLRQLSAVLLTVGEKPHPQIAAHTAHQCIQVARGRVVYHGMRATGKKAQRDHHGQQSQVHCVDPHQLRC